MMQVHVPFTHGVFYLYSSRLSSQQHALLVLCFLDAESSDRKPQVEKCYFPWARFSAPFV